MVTVISNQCSFNDLSHWEEPDKFLAPEELYQEILMYGRYGIALKHLWHHLLLLVKTGDLTQPSVRLWKNSSGQDKKTVLWKKKKKGSCFYTAQNSNMACRAHSLLWFPSIPAVTSSGLYMQFHLFLSSRLRANSTHSTTWPCFFAKTSVLSICKLANWVLSRAILISTGSKKQLITPDSACWVSGVLNK